jgi:hypothetical protein
LATGSGLASVVLAGTAISCWTGNPGFGASGFLGPSVSSSDSELDSESELLLLLLYAMKKIELNLRSLWRLGESMK